MTHNHDTEPWAREPNDDASRIALKRRQAHSASHWINVEAALKIEGTTDDTHLRMEPKLGLPCRFRHRGRWWVWKPVEEIAPLLTGRNPLDLQDDRWELVVHERYWRERLNKAVEPATRNPEEPATQPERVASPAALSTPSPEAEQQLPPPKVRATRRTTLEEYIAFQNDYREKYGMYASKKAERNWAKAKGRSAQHVRDELRPQYRDGLPPAKRTKFQSHSKKAQPPDDGR